MYHARFTGSHYEAGFRWGKRLHDHGMVIDSSPVFKLTDERRSFALSCIGEYEKHYPELLDEIKGIAGGMNGSFEILSTILFSMYCFEFENHCTGFAVADGTNIIFGRNSDFLTKVEKMNMNCLYRLDGAHAFNGNTTAFVEMEDGVNVYGLAVGLTFVYPHIRKPGLNAGMLVRYILEKCTTTGDVVRELKQLPIASAQTITLADRNGDIAVVECNPEKVAVIRPDEGESFVATANNFNSAEMEKYRNPDIDDWRSDERYRTACDALKNNRGKYSVEFAESLLSGKYGFICQYDRKQGADTVWSVIYDLKNKRIYRSEGNPRRNRFREDTRMKFQ